MGNVEDEVDENSNTDAEIAVENGGNNQKISEDMETDIPAQNEVEKSESEDVVPVETSEKVSEEVVPESDSKTEVFQVQPLEEKVSVKEAAETGKKSVET